MPLFRTKATEVEAIQFDGTSDCASRLLEKWPRVRPAVDRDGVFEGYIQVDVDDPPGRVLMCMPGSWIVREADGVLYVWGAEQFAAAFEPVKEDA